MTLNKRTTSTILASLRAYQRLLAMAVSDPQLVEAMDLASDGGRLTELSAEEIDSLCEDLNFDGVRRPKKLPVCRKCGLSIREAVLMRTAEGDAHVNACPMPRRKTTRARAR